MFVGHLYVFFGEISVWVFQPFFDWGVCFSAIELNELFIYVGYLSVLVISFENIFSELVGCLFVLLMVSFAVQKLLNLIRSHLFVFVFISITLGGGS